MARPPMFFFAFVLAASLEGSLQFDATILEDQPQIQCGNGGLMLRVAAEKGPPAHIFAKGHFQKDGCSFSNASQGEFDFTKCDISRQREVNPKGMAYTMTVVVQLHPLFTTRVDRAYRVRCFYRETEKIVGAEVSVSDPTPELLPQEALQPTCVYTLHKGSANGALAKYAAVGDVIYHVWECPSEVFEMHVHDCFVVDGVSSNNRKVIDSQGCSTDVFIMPQIIYNQSRRKAFVSSETFNFPDQNRVQFNCQIRICSTNSGDCYRPRCDGIVAGHEDPQPSDLDADELITTTAGSSSSSTSTFTTTAATTATSTTTAASTSTSTSARTTTTSSVVTATISTLSPTSTTATTTSTYTTTLAFTEPMTTTTPVEQDFPTPEALLKLFSETSQLGNDSRWEEIEGSGLEITRGQMHEVLLTTSSQPIDSGKTTKRELKRRDAIDVDISSPELMIVDREFASQLPAALSLAEESTEKTVCLPFVVVWILAGIALFAIAVTLTALCLSVKKRPQFHVLP